LVPSHSAVLQDVVPVTILRNKVVTRRIFVASRGVVISTTRHVRISRWSAKALRVKSEVPRQTRCLTLLALLGEQSTTEHT
jgi:hypothetical protein